MLEQLANRRVVSPTFQRAFSRGFAAFSVSFHESARQCGAEAAARAIRVGPNDFLFNVPLFQGWLVFIWGLIFVPAQALSFNAILPPFMIFVPKSPATPALYVQILLFCPGVCHVFWSFRWCYVCLICCTRFVDNALQMTEKHDFSDRGPIVAFKNRGGMFIRELIDGIYVREFIDGTYIQYTYVEFESLEIEAAGRGPVALGLLHFERLKFLVPENP